MGLQDELGAAVKKIFAEQWEVRDGRVVPDTPDLKLANQAVKLDGTVLYADMADSTQLVTGHSPQFAAEVYKAYLHCACQIVKADGGVITAFDGDRVMGVFIGDSKNTSATRAALKINHAVRNIINPAIKNQYPKTSYVLSQVVGIDTSEMLVARTGVRGANDLVWVGRAANYAAKLCSMEGYATWITEAVYDNMADASKFASKDKSPMWEKRTWTKYSISVYRSNWTWTV